MPQYGKPTGRDTIENLLKRVDDLENLVKRLSGSPHRSTFDRGDTGSVADPIEGQTLIQYDTETPKFYSNGSWRTFGGTAADIPWITVGDASSGDLITNGTTHSGADYTYGSGGVQSTNDAGTYYTFGSIAAAGTNGLTINTTGIYEALISAMYTATAGSPTQAGVEASRLELGYTWNGGTAEKQIHWDALQKGLWLADGPTTATKARWHPSWYRLLLAVTSTDVSASPKASWLTLNWTVHNPPPDCSVKGYPFMYVRRISDLVSLTNFSGGGV